MKKLSMFFCGLFIVTQLISANPDPGIIKHPLVKMDQSEASNQFIVHLANLQQHKTSITLSDQDGNTLHIKKISKANGRRLQYTLKGLEDGKYKITIDWNNQRSLWILSKNGEQIEFTPPTTVKEIWVTDPTT